GIVNGVDYEQWNPATDASLPAHYDVDTIATGKPLCKQALQVRCHLPAEPRTPVLGVVARLAEQKGIDLILGAAGSLLEQGTQLVVLGDGDPKYGRQLLEIRARYPERVSVNLAFDESLAHQIEAGADVFLMPSIYAPSGINQLYSMRSGPVPVVRATGGLADTVVDATPDTLAAGRATGFSFVALTPDALRECVLRSVALFRGEPQTWQQLMR